MVTSERKKLVSWPRYFRTVIVFLVQMTDCNWYCKYFQTFPSVFMIKLKKIKSENRHQCRIEKGWGEPVQPPPTFSPSPGITGSYKQHLTPQNTEKRTTLPLPFDVKMLKSFQLQGLCPWTPLGAPPPDSVVGSFRARHPAPFA